MLAEQPFASADPVAGLAVKPAVVLLAPAKEPPASGNGAGMMKGGSPLLGSLSKNVSLVASVWAGIDMEGIACAGVAVVQGLAKLG